METWQWVGIAGSLAGALAGYAGAYAEHRLNLLPRRRLTKRGEGLAERHTLVSKYVDIPGTVLVWVPGTGKLYAEEFALRWEICRDETSETRHWPEIPQSLLLGAEPLDDMELYCLVWQGLPARAKLRIRRASR